MDQSILLTIRSMIGGDEEYSASDPFVIELIIHINTVLGILNQLGIGVEGFAITGSTETWSDFIGESPVSLNEVQSYVFLRVQLLFDPPTSSVLLQAKTDMINELTWRMTTKVEVTNCRQTEAMT